MKIKTLSTALFMSLAALFCFACSQDKRDEMSNRMDNIGKDIDTVNQETRAAFVRDKEEFSDRVNKMIEKNKQDIAELKAKAKNKKEEAKREYDEKIDRLERKNDELKAKLAEYNYESKEKWQSFKEEFSHDMDELGQAISDLFRDNVKDKDKQ